MAIAPDQRNTGAKGTGITTLSYTATIGSIANGLFQVNCTTGSSPVRTVTGVLWDSGGANTALSNTVNGIGANKTENLGFVNAWIWYLLNPAAGTKTVKVTASGSCEITSGCSSYSGVDQASTFNAASPQLTSFLVGVNPSTTVTSAVGEYVIDSIGTDLSGGPPTMVVGAGQTSISNQDNGANTSGGAASDEPGAATVVMNWTGIGSSDFACQVCISIKPATGGGATDEQQIIGSGYYGSP